MVQGHPESFLDLGTQVSPESPVSTYESGLDLALCADIQRIIYLKIKENRFSYILFLHFLAILIASHTDCWACGATLAPMKILYLQTFVPLRMEAETVLGIVVQAKDF